MNAYELERIADLICNKLHSIENVDKTKSEHIELIKPILLDLAKEERNIGRNQILNHFKSEIETLKK